MKKTEDYDFGGGPNRMDKVLSSDIAVQATLLLHLENLDLEWIIVNCNPEQFSTVDYDTSDKLYFWTTYIGRCT